MNVWREISPNQALRAVTATTEPHDNVQTVRGTLGAIPARFRLGHAHLMITTWPGDLAYRADSGVVLLDGNGDVAYSFTAANPFQLPEPASAPAAPGLRLVRDAAS